MTVSLMSSFPKIMMVSNVYKTVMIIHPSLLVIEAGFTREYHVVEEDDDCRPNTVEVCVNSTGRIEKPITFNVDFFSQTAKGMRC